MTINASITNQDDVLVADNLNIHLDDIIKIIDTLHIYSVILNKDTQLSNFYGWRTIDFNNLCYFINQIGDSNINLSAYRRLISIDGYDNLNLIKLRSDPSLNFKVYSSYISLQFKEKLYTLSKQNNAFQSNHYTIELLLDAGIGTQELGDLRYLIADEGIRNCLSYAIVNYDLWKANPASYRSGQINSKTEDEDVQIDTISVKNENDRLTISSLKAYFNLNLKDSKHHQSIISDIFLSHTEEEIKSQIIPNIIDPTFLKAIGQESLKRQILKGYHKFTLGDKDLYFDYRLNRSSYLQIYNTKTKKSYIYFSHHKDDKLFNLLDQLTKNEIEQYIIPYANDKTVKLAKEYLLKNQIKKFTIDGKSVEIDYSSATTVSITISGSKRYFHNNRAGLTYVVGRIDAMLSLLKELSIAQIKDQILPHLNQEYMNEYMKVLNAADEDIFLNDAAKPSQVSTISPALQKKLNLQKEIDRIDRLVSKSFIVPSELVKYVSLGLFSKKAVDAWRLTDQEKNNFFYDEIATPIDVEIPEENDTLPSLDTAVNDREPATFKNEVIKSAYRVAGTQITKGTQQLLLSALPSDKAPLLTDFFASNFGAGFLSMVSGLLLTQTMQENEKVQKMAEEFRVQSLTTLGNEAAEFLMDNVLSVVKNSVKEIPEENGIEEMFLDQTTNSSPVQLQSSI